MGINVVSPGQLASKIEMGSKAVCINIRANEPVLLVYFTGSEHNPEEGNLQIFKMLIPFPCVA